FGLSITTNTIPSLALRVKQYRLLWHLGPHDDLHTRLLSNGVVPLPRLPGPHPAVVGPHLHLCHHIANELLQVVLVGLGEAWDASAWGIGLQQISRPWHEEFEVERDRALDRLSDSAAHHRRHDEL